MKNTPTGEFLEKQAWVSGNYKAWTDKPGGAANWPYTDHHRQHACVLRKFCTGNESGLNEESNEIVSNANSV
jgi:hypothetical protein